VKSILSAAVLLAAAAPLAVSQIAILHIRVTEGEGSINAPGSHNARPLTVEVTDETGRPVEGASVSFHLPEEGPSGTFGNGLRTDVTATDSRGRANLHTMQLNGTPGRFAIRIVASKENARAGMVSFQYIAEAKNGAAPATSSAPTASSAPAASSKTGPSVKHGALKWVVMAVLAGGAATAGALLAGRSGGAASAASAPSVTTSASTGIVIGSPSLSVGKP
jgi:hypothetical protein